MLIANKLPNPFYDQILSPYNPTDRALDFARHKMVRMYWRMLASVAGIAIVDHMELNIFPLELQLTYEIGKAFVEYIYPKKMSEAASAAS